MGKETGEKHVDESSKTRAEASGGAAGIGASPTGEGSGSRDPDASDGSPTSGLGEEGASGQRHAGSPLPEPSLKTFISGLAGQALINLGLFENPAAGKIERNLEQAKYSIDLLQILSDKMRGNLTDEEEKLINTALYDLRMRYVEACR